ncbi:MAG: type II secretion system protein GspL, partial [Hyphomonadaceae bacterium]|nr:type II secretion system protein GspL [Hyphomonadaceae bacterium]
TIGPDYLALPDGGSTRMVVADLFDRTLLRHGHWGVAVPEDLGQDMAGILAGQRADVEETVQIKAEDLWTEVCQGALKSRINLRRGAFAPRRPRSEFSWRQFRGPVLLALATVMLAIGVNVYEGMSFRAAAADMRADTTAMFRTAFPDVERIVNPRAQLRARLSTRAGSDPEFLIVSAWLALARDAAPGVTIESLRYDNQTGEFVLSVRYGDYTDLGALRSHIEAAGGRVEEGGSRQAVGGGRIGELTVRRP